MVGAIRIALIAISRNALRASLTVLGILIGVAAVVVTTAVGLGARESVGGQIQSLGSNVVIVFPENSRPTGARAVSGSGIRLTEDDGRAIAREAVSVSNVAPANRARAQIVRGDKNTSTQVIGTTLPFFPIRNWALRSGSFWTEADETLKAKVCILGTTATKNLFGTEDPVGQSVRIGRYPYRVLGVMDSKGEAAFGGDQDDVVLMPIGSMRARVQRTPPGNAAVLMISATRLDTTDRAVDQIDSILRQRHRIAPDGTPDFRIQTQKAFQQLQDTVYSLLTVLLVCVAAISLIVGGIGVMNIMLVSVTERTREIGIRMAIGARERDIRTQFLVEAVVLALLGGLSGALLGTTAIGALSKLFEWPMTLSPVALVVSIATSAGIGIAFGFFPARRASRLDPIVALRHE